jgi:ribosomal protein S2
MKKQNAAGIMVVAALIFGLAAGAQDNAQPAQISSQAPSTNSDTQNIQAYIELLRADVRQQKAEMVGAVMQLSAADAAKFWPIYEEYDTELAKLNDLRVANIKEYASSYDQMTDAKADELMEKAFSYRKQRSELLAKYYERVKQALGGIEAARFIQVEDQLLLIIDLQIDSSLPVVGQSS